MLRLYTLKRTAEIVAAMDPLIVRVSGEYGVPAACMRAVLFRGIREIDLMDAAADTAVRLGLFGRTDSSTGYAQIFSRTAIRALRFAEERGIETAESLGFSSLPSTDAAEDVRRMWLRLNRDRTFNLRMGTLNLLAAADEAAGETDFSRMTAEDLKRVFSRYNSSSCAVSSYGEEVYGLYLRFGGEPLP